jgi:WD40 repeat protein
MGISVLLSCPCRFVVTGAYDSSIRIWNLKKAPSLNEKKNRSTFDGLLEPLQIIKGHKSCVNCISFDKDGTRMYSADGMGVVKIWASSDKSSQFYNYECIKTVIDGDIEVSLALEESPPLQR